MKYLIPIDVAVLAKRQACKDPSKMAFYEWSRPESAQCDGCPAHCGMAAPPGVKLPWFKDPPKQTELAL